MPWGVACLPLACHIEFIGREERTRQPLLYLHSPPSKGFLGTAVGNEIRARSRHDMLPRSGPPSETTFGSSVGPDRPALMS